MTSGNNNHMDASLLADALERCFIAPNEPANIVDVVNRSAISLRQIANAICPSNALPFEGPDGLEVRSLTEAVIFMALSVDRVANAISDVADVIRETQQ